MKNYIYLILLFSHVTFAGEADVIEVKARYNGGNSFQIITTVKHGDTGWDHYADSWVILDEQGQAIGTRVLYHPHVKEQPFTRSHTLDIPESVKRITVRATDSVHGAGGKEVTIDLKR